VILTVYGTFTPWNGPVVSGLAEKKKEIMTLREILLAELEAERRAAADEAVEVVEADLRPGFEDAGYDPYDNPSHAKPLDIERPLKRGRQTRTR
jgi:hypothetical protein